MNFEHVREKLKHIPDDPGVYMMKDLRGEIIYVGKARILRNRVRSYFAGVMSKDLKTQGLVREIHDFEILITQNESEAILLERTLIRHHHPRYNITLKDGKEYPYLRINFNEDWPRIEKVRRRQEDGAYYLGPFSNAGYLNTTLKLMGRIFPLIRCSRYEFKMAKRPCNYYHMKLCLGPCTIAMDRDSYVNMLKDAIAFLLGKNKELSQELKRKMQQASLDEKYEDAALFRDQLQALEEVQRRQTVVVSGFEDGDVIGMHQGESSAAFCVLLIREGRLIGNETFLVKTPIPEKSEVLESFLLQYYDNRMLPHELMIPFALVDVDMSVLIQSLGPRDLPPPNYKTNVLVPQRGPRHDLLEMAEKNALYHYEESVRTETRNISELEVLQTLLRLADLPRRMECIDISNLQGQSIVASNVCFVDGKPAKDLYRNYSIKTLAEGEQNDFASIEEVVRRRLRRAHEDSDGPDLLVIDGGRTQLQSALKAALDYPELKVKIISLAKARVDDKNPDKIGAVKHTYERIFVPGEDLSIPLKPGSPEFRLLTRIRDEAHRFAIMHHRKKRAKKFVASKLDEIPGIGPIIKRRLIDTFGSIEAIRNANIDQLMKVRGVTEKSALLIHSSLKANEAAAP